jgi:hypothetical protein
MAYVQSPLFQHREEIHLNIRGRNLLWEVAACEILIE